jgi:hypothetical protein
MAPTPKKAALKRRPQTRASSSGAVGIVVRRGADRRFDALKRKIASLPAVVSWDRRRLDRRASSKPAQIDQRKTERRQKPPFTWEVADFVVVDRAAGTKRQTAKKKPV